VFAPLGAELGAERLVKAAEAFGFNEPSGIPGAATSTIPPAAELGDDLGVGSTAIGQGRVQATSLTMSLATAAIATGGVRPTPTLAAVSARESRRVSDGERRATPLATAKRVERMMVAVTRPGGTGTLAAIKGVQVAGKTGTAELKDSCEPDPANPEACPPDGDPQNTTAWFTAFAPAGSKTARAVVTVMLVGSGHGGDTAAPATKPVLIAALKATS
jgi:cell division protein FtsI/penicillin-binding protein 2